MGLGRGLVDEAMANMVHVDDVERGPSTEPWGTP